MVLTNALRMEVFKSSNSEPIKIRTSFRIRVFQGVPTSFKEKPHSLSAFCFQFINFFSTKYIFHTKINAMKYHWAGHWNSCLSSKSPARERGCSQWKDRLG
jgi:hypothetical protein